MALTSLLADHPEINKQPTVSKWSNLMREQRSFGPSEREGDIHIQTRSSEIRQQLQ